MPTAARPGRRPQPRSLIVTVFGAYARETGGWMSVSLVVRLLADLDVDEAAVRSSISRLKRRGLLVQERRNGVVGYALSPEARAILAAGDARIFTRDRAPLEQGWVLVAFSVPETERSARHLLRTELGGLGFGTVAPGVWIGPARLAEETLTALERRGLSGYAEVFTADHLAFGELRSQVARWWDLDAVEAECGAYVERWSPVLTAARRRRAPDPAGAFRDFVGTLTDWRRLPYLDPGLPAEVLPARWQGVRAATVFFALLDLLQEPAHAHVEQLQQR